MKKYTLKMKSVKKYAYATENIYFTHVTTAAM